MTHKGVLFGYKCLCISLFVLKYLDEILEDTCKISFLNHGSQSVEADGFKVLQDTLVNDDTALNLTAFTVTESYNKEILKINITTVTPMSNTSPPLESITKKIVYQHKSQSGGIPRSCENVANDEFCLHNEGTLNFKNLLSYLKSHSIGKIGESITSLSLSSSKKSIKNYILRHDYVDPQWVEAAQELIASMRSLNFDLQKQYLPYVFSVSIAVQIYMVSVA